MVPDIHSDLIRGNVNTIIMRVLSDGSKYGFEICKEVELRSRGQYTIKQPTLYSCLSRLEEQGFVSSYWGGKTGGGRRKYYSLTDKGLEFFAKSQTDWEYSRTVIDHLISDKAFDLSALAPADIEVEKKTEKEGVISYDELSANNTCDGIKAIEAHEEIPEEIIEDDNYDGDELEEILAPAAAALDIPAKNAAPKMDAAHEKAHGLLYPADAEEKGLYINRNTSIYDAPAPDYSQQNNAHNVTAQTNDAAAEERFIDREYRNILNRMVAAPAPAIKEVTTNHSQVYPQASQPQQEAEYTIRRYDKQTQAEYSSKYYVRSNKLRFVQFSIIAAIMLIEIIAIFVAVNVIQNTADIFANSGIYIAGITAAVVIFAVGGAIYLANPKATKRIDFSLGASLSYKFFTTLLGIILVVAVNLYHFKNSFGAAENYVNLLLPIILITNIMLSSIIYRALYKNKQFTA
jgi:PadR family transcriptional regulator PadR